MPRALVATGMELEYDSFGDSADPAMLLIMGLSAQLTAWDERLCQMFAGAGRFVIRFDNAIVAHTSTDASVISAAVANR